MARLVFPPLRPCLIISDENHKQKALFHCWGNQAYVVGASPLTYGHLGGQVWNVYGIVELEDGEVIEVPPGNIQFLDDKFKDYAWPDGGEMDGQTGR